MTSHHAEGLVGALTGRRPAGGPEKTIRSVKLSSANALAPCRHPHDARYVADGHRPVVGSAFSLLILAAVRLLAGRRIVGHLDGRPAGLLPLTQLPQLLGQCCQVLKDRKAPPTGARSPITHRRWGVTVGRLGSCASAADSRSRLGKDLQEKYWKTKKRKKEERKYKEGELDIQRNRTNVPNKNTSARLMLVIIFTMCGIVCWGVSRRVK